MNATRAEAGLPPLVPGERFTAALADEFEHFDVRLAIEPRVIDGGPVALRPTRPKPATAEHDARDLLRAATILIPNQPTTEQWQTLKQAILDL